MRGSWAKKNKNLSTKSENHIVRPNKNRRYYCESIIFDSKLFVQLNKSWMLIFTQLGGFHKENDK